MRAFWKEYVDLAVQRRVVTTLAGAVVQEYDFGGRGQTITIEIPHCPHANFATLKDASGDATLVTKELDGDEAEVTREFFGLVQLSIFARHDRAGTNLDYRDVVAVFVATKNEDDD
jgi:hypothetical protein